MFHQNFIRYRNIWYLNLHLKALKNCKIIFQISVHETKNSAIQRIKIKRVFAIQETPSCDCLHENPTIYRETKM